MFLKNVLSFVCSTALVLVMLAYDTGTTMHTFANRGKTDKKSKSSN